MHFIHGSYFFLNYLVDFALLIGAFYSGAKWFDRRAKKRQAKKDAEFGKKVRDSVTKSLNDLLPDAVDDFLDETLDDAVSESINVTFGDMFKKVDAIFSQTHDNGGRSITDSQKRLEETQNKLLKGMADVLENQSIQKVLINGIDDRARALSTDFAKHIGKHEEEERANNVKAVEEARHVAEVEAARVHDRQQSA